MSELIGPSDKLRPVEGVAMHAVSMEHFFSELRIHSPRGFALAAALCDGMSVEEISQGFDVSKQILYERIRNDIAPIAAKIYGEEPIRDRARTGARAWI